MDCLLILKIGKSYYKLSPIIPAPGVALRAWNLEKKDGKRYCVSLDQFGISCDCGDFHWRKQNTGKTCKHAAALNRFGLLEARHA